MATAVGAVRFDMIAEVGSFVRDMGKARKAVTSGSARMNKSMVRFNRRLTLGAKKAKRFASSMLPLKSMLAGVAAGGFVIMTKRAIESADAIGKTADKVGFGVEALQELRFAAEQTGVKITTLDMALQRFSRRIGEVAQGQGELLGVAQQYGIELRNAEGGMRSSIDIMGDFAEVIKGAESAQERLRISFKLFDSEGAALVNLMKRGKAGIEELRAEARRLGLVLDESMVRAAERANDQLNIMSKILSTNLTRLLVGLSPTIVRIGTALSESAPKIKAWVESWLPSSVAGPEELGRRMREIEGDIRVLFGTARQGGVSWSEFIASIDAGSLKTDAARDRLHALAVELRTLDDAIKKANAQNAALRLTVGAPPSADPQFDKEKKEAATAAQKFFERERIKAAAIAKSTDALKRQAEQQKQLTAALVLGAEAHAKVKNQIDLENTAASLNIDLTMRQGQAWAEAAMKAQAAADGLVKATEDREKAFATIRAGVETVGDTLSRAVNDVLFYGKTWADVASNIGRSILENLVSSLVQAGTTMAANFAISQAFGAATAAAALAEGAAVASAWAPAAALASLATLGGNAAPAAAALSSTMALSQGLALIPREAGGPVTAGRGYLVGEGGPEAFFPKTAGIIVPNEGAGGGQAAAVPVNITIVANDAKGFGQLIRENRGTIVSIVREAQRDRGVRAGI